MPGMLDLTTLSGRGDNHRSGFHSYASGPQINGLVFACMTEMIMSVPFFRGITFTSCLPSAAFTGHIKGSDVSSKDLRVARKWATVRGQCHVEVAYVLNAVGAGGNSLSVSRITASRYGRSMSVS